MDGAASVTAADLDGDGDTDVLASAGGEFPSSQRHRTLVWYESDGAAPPGFAAHTLAMDPDRVQAIFVADLDGDADADILAGIRHVPGTDELVWFDNDGANPPGFLRRIVTGALEQVTAVAAVDLDGDADMDLLSLSSGDPGIVWYENDGGGSPSFTARGIAPADSRFGSIGAADFDGDGDQDLLVAWSFTNSRIEPEVIHSEFTWYESDAGSPPAFTPHPIAASAEAALRMASPADLDSDGDLDLLAVWGTADKIAWYVNDGASPPIFTERVLTQDPDGPEGPRQGPSDGPVAVAAADLNDDGDVDFVCALSEDDAVARYENRGGAPPAFVRHTITTDVDAPQSVHIADVDGDGDLDVLSASALDGRIAWYRNRLLR